MFEDQKKLIPSSKAMMNDVVAVIIDSGGKCRSSDMDRMLQKRLGVSTELSQIRHKEGANRTEFQYRSAWARTYCKKKGLIAKDSDGNWILLVPEWT